MMDYKELLIGILLVATIVLVIFLIILVANATDTIKKANAIIDGGTTAAANAKAKVDNVSEKVNGVTSKVGSVASLGITAGQKIVDKVIR